MACNCQVCQDIKRWKAGLEDPVTRKEIFEEMFGRIEDAETSEAYYHSILDGTWPNAEQILERALAKIKEKRSAAETEQHK